MTHSFHFQFDSGTSCIKLNGRYKNHLMVVIASWTISKDNLWSKVSLYITLTIFPLLFPSVPFHSILEYRLKGCRIKILFDRCSSSLCSSLRDPTKQGVYFIGLLRRSQLKLVSVDYLLLKFTNQLGTDFFTLLKPTLQSGKLISILTCIKLVFSWISY